MEVSNERFEKMERKVDQIWDYLKGNDLRPHGAESRIHKNKQNITKLWVTVYGILTGILGLLFFIIKWGDNIF